MSVFNRATVIKNCWATAFSLTLLMVGTVGRAAIVLDQSFDAISTVNSWSGVGGWAEEFPNKPAFAQTFTVGVGGRLAGVDLLVYAVRPYDWHLDDPLVVELRRTLNGAPVEDDSQVLASVSLPPNRIPASPTSSFTRFNFLHAQHEVSVGEVLAIVLWTNSPSGDSEAGYYAVSGFSDMSLSGYSGGASFNRPPPPPLGIRDGFGEILGNDFLFRTYVNTVPEPTTFAVFSIGLIALAFGARFRHSLRIMEFFLSCSSAASGHPRPTGSSGGRS